METGSQPMMERAALTAVAPEHVSTVSRAQEAMAGRIDDLARTIGVLGDKLARVLGPIGDESPSLPPPETTDCDITRWIDARAVELGVNVRMLQALCDRIEL